MKSAAKKLIASAVVLVIALSLAVTSTFAWFTMSATPKVNEFNVNVTTSDGLTIALTQTGIYRSTITKDQFLAEYGTALGGVSLTAVSSADGDTFTKYTDEALTTTTAAELNKDYFEFTFHFSSSSPLDIYLDDVANTYLTSEKEVGSAVKLIQAWEAIAEDTYGDDQAAFAAGDNILAAAENAARVSFTALDFAATPGSSYIWYPHPDAGYNKDILETGAKNLAYDYYKQLLGTSTTVPAGYREWHEADIFTTKLLTLTKVNSSGSPLHNAYYGALKIRIWLEGWDGDCFNSIFDDVLSVAFQFNGVGTPAPTPTPETTPEG